MKPRIILKLHNFDPKTTFVLIGKRYNFASIVDFDSLGVLRKILGDVIFSFSPIKDLGNLTTIGGRANFEDSAITDLANLTTIGGSVNFTDSKITNLANLSTIVGNADFSFSKITDLGNLTTIGGGAYFQASKITDLGNLTTIGGDAKFENSQVQSLGNLTKIGGDANFKESQITDLGNLTTIGGKGIFLKSKVENLGNLQSIEGNASFVGSRIKDLSNLTTIGGDAVFGNSPIMDLGNLQTIGGDAYFNDSQITDLGNLTTIEGDAYFEDSEIMDLGNLQTIGGRADFGDREDLQEEWERRQNKYKKGGRTISQTPAPKKDRVYGSEKNKPKSSTDTKSAEKITFSEKTLESIEKKVNEHNKAYPNKKITLASAKAVVRRGMGAYSSTHRPTISGGKPNSRVAWGLARLNAFIYKIINGKSKSGKYSQDNDLIEELGYKVDKYEIGGIFHGSRSYFDKFSTNKIGSGIGQQEDGWGIYLTDDKESSKNYGNYIYETTLFKGKSLDEYIFLDLNKPVKKDIESKIIEYFQKAGYNVSELNEFNYSGYLFYKTLSRKLGGDKKASFFLLNNGIDGLRRTFENSKGVVYRTDYVIFDENAITIERKEYLPNNYFSDGGLIAPNGKPSNLTPEQYKLVREPEFKAWFGDWENDPENSSKVIDENGEPLVVYHGTTKDFYVFKKADKYRKEWGIRDYGMYFSNSEFTAKEYSLDYEYKTDEYQEWNNKLEEYKKQQDWESWKKLYVEKKDQFSKDYSKKYKSIRVIKCFLNIRNAFIVEGNENYWYKVLKGTTDIAIDNKNDGIIALNIKEVFEDVQNTYVVFEPEQIKLADGTNTTFDGNNPDIRYKMGGQPFIRTESQVSRSKLFMPNVRGGWTKDKIIKYFKLHGSDVISTYRLVKYISEFENWQQFKEHIFYHGTTNYIEKGLKPSITMSEREAERSGGGGYGIRYFGVSLTSRKRTAENFSGMYDGVTIYPVILKRDAKVIERTDLQDASDIEDIIVELYEQGVDAVWIGGGEEELVVINPFSVLLYKKGKEYHSVFGGFKSIPLTDEKIKEIYDSSLKLWENYSEEYKKKENKEERENYLRSLPPIQFEKGGLMKRRSRKRNQ